MSKVKAAGSTDKAVNVNERFNGKTLAESRHFSRVLWAATVALDPNTDYTLDEAEKAVSAFLSRKVG